ncbi:hypothetical protein ACFVYR_27235 [Streptomyces sp. NPDC058284]|uniref:hypothetical protein n=1 Tax=unclassified Streptomyces TaxID=2593676 RepID=UPI00365BE27A
MTPTDMGTDTGIDTGPAHLPNGRRRRTLVALPASAESVPRRSQDPSAHQAQYPPQHQAPQQSAHQSARPPQPHQHVYQQPNPNPYMYQHPSRPHQQAYQQPYQQMQPQPQAQQAQAQDPPIYGALIRHWADRGRTLPGRHDPEWARLVASPVRLGQFSAASRDPRGDAR